MFHAKKGMSAHQIHRMIGTGSYETAWYMCTRIRAAMKDEQLPKLMGEMKRMKPTSEVKTRTGITGPKVQTALGSMVAAGDVERESTRLRSSALLPAKATLSAR